MASTIPVDMSAVPGVCVGPQLGQQLEGSLAGAVDARARGRARGRDGGHVDHRAVSALDHPWDQLLDQDVGRAQVGVDLIVGVGIGGVDGRREPVDARVVDQDVDVARLGGQPPHIVGVRYVGGDETCLAAYVFDVAHGLGATLGITPVHDHLGAFVGELHRDGVTDACRRAGDECGGTA
jgi:hypothetical protein